MSQGLVGEHLERALIGQEPFVKVKQFDSNFEISRCTRQVLYDGIGFCSRPSMAIAAATAAAAALEIISDSEKEIQVVYLGIDVSGLSRVFQKMKVDAGNLQTRIEKPYIWIGEMRGEYEVSLFSRRNGRILCGICPTFDFAYVAAEVWQRLFKGFLDCKDPIEIFNSTSTSCCFYRGSALIK